MKKRFFLILAFIFCSIFVLSKVGIKEVKAEQNCVTHTNYYMFLDSTDYDSFKREFAKNNGEYSYKRETEKFYDGDKLVGYDIGDNDHGMVSLGTSCSGSSCMTYSSFYDIFSTIGSDNIKTVGNSHYIKSRNWSENGIDYNKGTPVGTKEAFLSNIPTNHGRPEFSDVNFANGTFSISRTWNEEDFDEDKLLNYEDTDKIIIMSPAVYYVNYKVCEEIYTVDVKFVDIDDQTNKLADNKVIKTNASLGEEVEYDCSLSKFNDYVLYTDNETDYPTNPSVVVDGDETLTCYYKKTESNNSLIVEFKDEETGETLKDNYNSGNKFAKGDSYQYSCDAIPGYTVVNSSNHPSSFEGTFNGSDITRQCYYTKNTYTLTINYGSEEECINLLKESDSYELKYKETNTYDVPDKINKMTSPTLGLYSNKFNEAPKLDGTKLTVTMPAKNVDVCIVYTPQTGDSWIYFVWVVGILALGYSIWYFVRYYKKQNNEI